MEFAEKLAGVFWTDALSNFTITVMQMLLGKDLKPNFKYFSLFSYQKIQIIYKSYK